jgi:hypothetical protein
VYRTIRIFCPGKLEGIKISSESRLGNITENLLAVRKN